MRAKLTPTPSNTDRLAKTIWKPPIDAGVTKTPQTWRTTGDDGEDFSIIGAYEQIGPEHAPDWRWHLSVAGAGRVPTWDEMAAILHMARPGVPFALGVPPRSWWLNVHEHCLHAWEINDPNLTDLWRAERRGHTPT